MRPERERAQLEHFLQVSLLVLRSHLQDLFDLQDELERVREQLVLTAVLVGGDLGERNPFSVENFRRVLHANSLVHRTHHTDNIEVCRSVLVVHLLSHGKHALELGLDASLFEDLTLHRFFDGLAAIDQTAR